MSAEEYQLAKDRMKAVGGRMNKDKSITIPDADGMSDTTFMPPKKPSNFPAVQDAKLRKKEEAAPTTKTEMGKVFKKGGAVRGWGKARGARAAKYV